MKKLVIRTEPVTKSQFSGTFTDDITRATTIPVVLLSGVESSSGTSLLINRYPLNSRRQSDGGLAGSGIANAIAVRITNLQFQGLQNVAKLELITEVSMFDDGKRKAVELSPYNTMDAFQESKITIDADIVITSGASLYLKVTPLDPAETTSVSMFCDVEVKYPS